jgi:regulator of sigma E protease
MEPGDTILSINGALVQNWYDLYDIINESERDTLLIKWSHAGETREAYVVPRAEYNPLVDDTVGRIDILKPYVSVHLSPLEIVAFSAQGITNGIMTTLGVLYRLTTGKISRRALGGPIAIAQLTRESLSWGIEFLFGLVIMISVNLGLINLFPLPALDGGHIVIGIIEALRKKRFSRRTRLVIQQIGYALIFLLIIFVTFNDITR